MVLVLVELVRVLLLVDLRVGIEGMEGCMEGHREEEGMRELTFDFSFPSFPLLRVPSVSLVLIYIFLALLYHPPTSY